MIKPPQKKGNSNPASAIRFLPLLALTQRFGPDYSHGPEYADDGTVAVCRFYREFIRAQGSQGTLLTLRS